MSKTKKTAVIAIVLVMAMALASFGFAAWSQNLTVSGTATVDGKWDVKITNIVVETSTAGVAATAPAIDSNGVTDATIPNAEFSLPGAWVEYTITVTNNGSVAANLDSFVFSLTGEDADMFTFTCAPLDTATDVIAANGGTCEFTAVLQLNDNGDAEASDLSGSANINISLGYGQDAIAPAAPTASHTDH